MDLQMLDNKFKGLPLLVIMLGSIAVIPVLADTNSSGSMNMTNPTMGGIYPPASMLNSNQSSPIGTPSSGALAVTVTTDKSSYNDGDKVMISCTTLDYMGDTPLTLILRNTVRNVIKVDQITVGTDKPFSTSVIATGAL